jgi:hypothetical protein
MGIGRDMQPALGWRAMESSRQWLQTPAASVPGTISPLIAWRAAESASRFAGFLGRSWEPPSALHAWRRGGEKERG